MPGHPENRAAYLLKGHSTIPRTPWQAICQTKTLLFSFLPKFPCWISILSWGTAGTTGRGFNHICSLPPTAMWESPSTAPAFPLVSSSRKRDVFSYLVTKVVWRVSKGIALPLLQYCSLLCEGCPTYTCHSRQGPGFLLEKKGTFPFDSCCLLPSLAHSGHLFSCSNRENNFAGRPRPEIQNSVSEILQESFFCPRLQNNRRKQVLKIKVTYVLLVMLTVMMCCTLPQCQELALLEGAALD